MHPNCKCVPPKQSNRWQVKKENENKGRWFFTCSQCKFFQWDGPNVSQAHPTSSPRQAAGPPQQSSPHANPNSNHPSQSSPNHPPRNLGGTESGGAGPSTSSASGVGAGVDVTLQLLSEDEFAASFPYSPSLIDLINRSMDKEHTGRSWDPDLKAWRFKMAARVEVTSIFSSAGCKVHGFDPRALGIIQGLAAHQSAAGPSSSTSPSLKGSKSSYAPSMTIQEAEEMMRTSLPSETTSALFEFQKEGVAFIVRHGGRVLLADEPGLGKTVQAICAASCFPQSWPLLVICPSSMRFVWAAAVQDWIPDHLRPSPQHVWVVRSSKDLKDAGAAEIQDEESDDEDEDDEEEEDEEGPKKKKRRKSSSGRKRRTSRAGQMTGPPPPGVKAHVCITSHALVQKMDRSLLDRYQFVIVDESHCLKSRETKMTAFISALVKRTKHALLLTGTPLLSRPIEIWPQCDMLRSGLFGTYVEFGQRYCVNPNQQHSGGGGRGGGGGGGGSPGAAWFASGRGGRGGGGRGGGGSPAAYWMHKQNEFKGACNLGELNLLLTSTILIRRTKASVALQLPDKIRSRIRVEVDPQHAAPLAQAHAKLKDIDERRNAGDEDPQALSNEKDSAIQELFRATGPAKVRDTLEFIESLLSAAQGGGTGGGTRGGRGGGGDGEQTPFKVLVFGHHQVVLDALEQGLNAHRCIRIEGSTSALKRSQLVDLFQSDKDVRVALLSMTAAGTGLTLTAASAVVFSELAWNPSVLVQAEDRSHRIGQGRVVNVYYTTAQGTADDIMWSSVQKKLGIVGQTLGERGAQMKISPFKPAPPPASTSAAAAAEGSGVREGRSMPRTVVTLDEEAELEEEEVRITRLRTSLGGGSTQGTPIDPIEIE